METINKDLIIFRKLKINDYEEFLSLINDFRKTYFTKEDFIKNFYFISQSSDIYVLEYNNKLIACGKLLYERKYINNICTLGHIEDVCVKEGYRKYGLGKLIITKIVERSKENGCYKVTLNCLDYNVAFYKKCNFEKSGNQMTIYFNH